MVMIDVSNHTIFRSGFSSRLLEKTGTALSNSEAVALGQNALDLDRRFEGDGCSARNYTAILSLGSPPIETLVGQTTNL